MAAALVIAKMIEVPVEQLVHRDALLGAVRDISAIADPGHQLSKRSRCFLLRPGHAAKYPLGLAIGADSS